ncbi:MULTISPECIES: FG-GAP repeat domain-containing protein [unclassified Marinovum]
MKAPRLPLRPWPGLTRGALLMSSLWLGGAAAAQTDAVRCVAEVESASYEMPTDRYPHGVLGDDLEWGTLRVATRAKPECTAGGGDIVLRLPSELVFEDVAPRVVDLDGQGPAEIVVVESHATKGARLAVWGFRNEAFLRLAATPFIGTRFRWLAPVGAADLDGDGVTELAYVDRPHLAKTLRIWRYLPRADGLADLEEAAALPGVTNHRIGESNIAGGIRDCGQGPEMIVADAAWREVLALRYDGAAITMDTLGPHIGRESFAQALDCQALQ